MAIEYSPSIVTSDLAFYYDMGNTQKSFRGPPTTNLTPNMSLQAVQGAPTVSFVGVEDGWNKYSLSGTWTSGTYPYSMAVQAVTFTGGVTYSTGAFIKTTVPQKFASLFSGMNYVNEPMNNVGTSFSITQPDGSIYVGRSGFQYTNTTTQVGYLLSQPIIGQTFNGATDFVFIRQGQIEIGSFPTPFVAGTRTSDNNFEATPNFPTWNTAGGSSASGGTLTFGGGSHNSKGVWDLYKTYSGLSTGVNYTWSALVRAGTANNFIVTMNNTQSWNTGPSAVFTGLSNSEWTRVSIVGTTNTGSFNLHLGSSANSEVAGTVQNAGTILIQDVSLVLRGDQRSLNDLTGQNNIAAVSLTYESTGTFRFFGSNYIDASVTPFNMHNLNVWLYNDYVIPGNDSAIGGVVTPYQSPINFNRQTTQGINLGGWTGSATNESVHIWSNSSTNSGFNGMTHIREEIPIGWHNFQFNWNGSTYDIWIDGVKRTTFAANFGHATLHPVNAIRIGGDVAQSYYFVGRIPVVTMYNRQLSDAEVQQNFNALRGRFGI